jgi:hypothetical protein
MRCPTRGQLTTQASTQGRYKIPLKGTSWLFPKLGSWDFHLASYETEATGRIIRGFLRGHLFFVLEVLSPLQRKRMRPSLIGKLWDYQIKTLKTRRVSRPCDTRKTKASGS